MKGHWVLLALLSMPACGSNDEGDTDGSGATTSMNEAGASAMPMGNEGGGGSTAVSEPFDTSELEAGPAEVPEDFETSDDFVTRLDAPRIGLASSPHKLQQIFYSSNIEPVLGESAFGELPEGTVAVKNQSRDGDDVIDQVMVMVKQAPGTDPDHGDWIWEQRRPGTLSLVTSSEDDEDFLTFCSSCHGGYTTTDWLAGTGLAD
jgi:hypothetical protein